jgi:RNA polymerase subunit RPABC4/transcription elongation factor Spt4
MATNTNRGGSPFSRLRARYESTDKKCPACGHVDETGNWTSHAEGARVVYHHVCPSCGADREHVLELGRR